MENKSEQLFNSLIKRGRVSFGDYDIAEFDQIGNTFVAINYESKVIGQFNIRQLVSKESGLWQFVCENGMVKGNGQYESSAWIRAYEDERDSEEYTREYGVTTAEYYLLESSLKDESELEDFLLDNIKIEGEV